MPLKTLAHRTVLLFLPLAFAVTGLSGLVALAVQQDLRQGANDPQIQIAEDAAVALSEGKTPISVVPDTSIEISQSLSPFIMVFGPDGGLILGDARLYGEPPALPPGLLDEGTWSLQKGYATPAGSETRVTWQPHLGVRAALVVVHAKNGMFVAVGRSLRLAEERESALMDEVLLAWFVTVIGTLFVSAFCAYMRKP